MKKLITGFVLLTSLSSYACLDITGNYLCPEGAADDLALGTREIRFRKSPMVDMYSVGVSSSSTVYEVNSWNPAIDPSTGEIDHRVLTMAECKESSVVLHSQLTLSEDGIEVTMVGGFEVTPLSNGIQLKILLEGEDFFNFDCEKI